MKRFKGAGVGCWGDGTFGHKHVRERLSILVREADGELADSLLGDMPDDAWDEDAALDILNEQTAVDFVWEFVDGDLMLSPISDGDEEPNTFEGWKAPPHVAGKDTDPECSICRGRHPMDDRHPCE